MIFEFELNITNFSFIFKIGIQIQHPTAILKDGNFLFSRRTESCSDLNCTHYLAGQLSSCWKLSVLCYSNYCKPHQLILYIWLQLL
jgi:hypothetical protein